ncbi:unnamed protein product [Rhizoctonia solani]|uniref:Uncharacterized protein n=1 Tax=Rhizoctonia solani TaxID=456999 RepID=A0A8H3I2H4_9AGAM|nr:unnamed protein product [Rhizoctonia solani]
MRKTNDPELDFIDRANEILDAIKELLELIHLPNARADSSHRPLLDMSLSVLAMLADWLLSITTRSNKDSLEYFRLSKRSLMIATLYLPKAHSAKPIIASHWGTLYLLRFQLFGKNDHITQAIKFYQQGLKDIPVNYPKRAMFLGSLGRSYLARFGDSQLADDLKNGIKYNARAWKEIESEEGALPKEKKRIFEGTNRGLQCLIEHVGGSNSISLINAGIREWENTLGEVLRNDETKGDFQSGSQNPLDLERSVAFLAAAVALLPRNHSDLLSTLYELARSLAAKARDEASLELALDFLKLAETLTTPAFKPHLFCSFGDLYMSLSRRETDLAHLEFAIDWYNSALKHPNCPPGSRLWAKVRQNLGVCGIYCYNILNTEDTYSIGLRPLAAGLLTQLHIPRSERNLCTAMELIPLLACFGAVPDQRRKATQKSGQLATEAAATAIAIGKKEYPTAIALLEQGRSVKWNHMLQLQSPLYMLKSMRDGGPLAERLEEVLKDIQLGAENNASTGPAGQSSLKLDDLNLQDRYQKG